MKQIGRALIVPARIGAALGVSLRVPPLFEALRKSIEMLPAEMRRRWLMLVPLALVTGIMEMGAAAGVFALVSLLTRPGAETSWWLRNQLSRLPWQGRDAVVVQFCVLLGLFYVAKGAMSLWASYMRIRVSHDASAQLASGMLRRYLSAPYPFHFRRNSAELIRNCTSSVGEVLGGVLAAATSFVNDLLMGLGVIAVLLYTSPGVAIACGVVLVGVIWIVLRVTRRLAGRHGDYSYQVSAAILQSLQQALGGIKEVKVLGREQYFYDAFAERQRQLRQIGYLGVALLTVPPMAIQTVLFCGALALVVAMTLAGRTGSETLPVAGVFGYAGLRILPMAQGLVVTVNGIRGRKRWVDELHEDYLALEGAVAAAADSSPHLTFRDQIVLDEVSYTYPGGDHPAVEAVSLAIRHGESVGIVGPTGAGKSTLVDLVLGLLPPTTGRITVDGIPLTNASAPWKRRVGYVPQALFLIDDTLRRNIALGIRDEAIDDARVLEVVRMAQLETFLAELPLGLETRIGERGIRLSGGERQRVAIARALYHDPDLIVFDEATASLDVVTEAEVTRTIEALRGAKTMIVIAHRLGSVRRCDRLIWLRRGRVEGLGSFDELRRSSGEFRALETLSRG
jgi:ABC-type multidrug transport system fused ATPase/permease subunit